MLLCVSAGARPVSFTHVLLDRRGAQAGALNKQVQGHDLTHYCVQHAHNRRYARVRDQAHLELARVQRHAYQRAMRLPFCSFPYSLRCSVRVGELGAVGLLGHATAYDRLPCVLVDSSGSIALLSA